MKDRLSQEDLDKLKRWGLKHQTCKKPHCGERCIVIPENKVDNAGQIN